MYFNNAQNTANNAQSMVGGGAPFMQHFGNPMQPGGGRLNNLQIVNQTAMNGAIAGLKDLIGEYEDASISNIKELQSKYPLQEICRRVFDTLTKLQAQKFMQRLGRRLAEKWGRTYSEVAGFQFSRTSIAIVRAVSMYIRATRNPIHSKRWCLDDGGGALDVMLG